MSEEKILVVEDDVLSGEALREKLSALGYRVGPPAVSGEEAVARAAEALPDLVLMDIKLAGALDGIDAALRIQERQDVPVLYLTAYTDDETLRRAKLSAPYSYLVKPVRDRELHVTVEMALHRHRLEKALRDQYRRLSDLEKLKDNLIHMIVHDMRSPLTLLLGHLEMAYDTLDGDRAAVKEHLDGARHGADDLMNMINSLLDVSRLEEGKMPLEPIECDLFDLAGVALSTYALPARRRNIALSLEGDSAPVKADPALIRRVFVNLLDNALKFTPAGGAVTLAVSRDGSAGVAELTDSGPEIPPEYYERIFDKFGQMANRNAAVLHHSSGLGLTFCKLAIEAHGGKIGIAGVPGRGNRFWFSLPGLDG